MSICVWYSLIQSFIKIADHVNEPKHTTEAEVDYKLK